MKLAAELLNITAGERKTAIKDEETASSLGVHSSDRIHITHGNKQTIALANIAANFPQNHIGLYAETSETLQIKDGETVEVTLAQMPESLSLVRAKLRGDRK